MTAALTNNEPDVINDEMSLVAIQVSREPPNAKWGASSSPRPWVRLPLGWRLEDPLEHARVPALGGLRACLLVPRVVVLPRPLQHLQSSARQQRSETPFVVVCPSRRKRRKL
jgi:hypothetical protein